MSSSCCCEDMGGPIPPHRTPKCQHQKGLRVENPGRTCISQHRDRFRPPPSARSEDWVRSRALLTNSDTASGILGQRTAGMYQRFLGYPFQEFCVWEVIIKREFECLLLIVVHRIQSIVGHGRSPRVRSRSSSTICRDCKCIQEYKSNLAEVSLSRECCENRELHND